jgi:serine/threonine protein phosphatase PrpC
MSQNGDESNPDSIPAVEHAWFESAVVVEGATDGYKSALEDRAAILPAGNDAASPLIVVVADGAGGRAGGAEAAEQTLRCVLAWTSEQWGTRMSGAVLAGLLSNIDAALVADALAGETTGVVLALSPASIMGASAGDSEAWRIGADGTLAEDLTRRQRRLRLGTGAAGPVWFEAAHPLAPGQTLLVASDGLFKYADATRIVQTVADAATTEPLEPVARRLVNLVRLRSGALPDDVAVVLCRCRLVMAPDPGPASVLAGAVRYWFGR